MLRHSPDATRDDGEMGLKMGLSAVSPTLGLKTVSPTPETCDAYRCRVKNAR